MAVASSARFLATFDFVIIGAGTAGCVLANRLSADPRRSVLLIEAGGRDWNPILHIPTASGKAVRQGLHGWRYFTEPEAGLNGRSVFWPRGKVLGGSSSINGMVYIRGHASDYDHWAQLGNRGWSYDDVLPYFRRSEGHQHRDDEFHGRDGELKIKRGDLENPLFDALVEAGVQAGYPRSDDFNGAEQDGFGRFDFNIIKGRRQSTAVAFLRPAQKRPNLTVVSSAMVARIVFEGTRATGVEYRQHGMLWRAGAARQVVLCGGTIGSAHVLQLSGVGVADDIRAVGIDVVKHLPGVGRNLQDHAQLPVTFGCSKPLTMHQMIRVDRAAWHMLRAVVTGEGPFAQFPTQAGGFTRSRPDLAAPDIQWHFGNFLGVDRVRVPYPGRKPGPLERDGFLFSMCQLRPESRGDIRIVSPDPEANPAIRPNYLSAPRDLEVMIFAVKEARRVAGQKALSPYLDGEIAPGAAVRSDDEIAGWVRSALGTVHHQVGTCKMGSDPMAVVDDTLAVHGLQGLTVADASIMPTLVGGNTHAPVIMIAEKAADFVKARAG